MLHSSKGTRSYKHDLISMAFIEQKIMSLRLIQHNDMHKVLYFKSIENNFNETIHFRANFAISGLL